MSKIDEKIEKAANDYAKSLYECGMYEKSTPATPSDMMYAFIGGARWALSHQWRSVEEDGLPKPKDYEYYLLPCVGSDEPAIYVVNSFLLHIEYNDGSGYDLCEANFKVLPDGRFYWLFADDYFASMKIEDYKVTHWMPIPPLPEARKEERE